MTDRSLGSMIMEVTGPDTGPAVVMVHGLGGDSNSFQPLMGIMEGFRVLRPDLPGAGRSPIRPGRSGIQGMADNVLDALRAAGVAKAHFVGHSMGTLVCQYIAAQHPECVTALTLMGPILEPPIAARAGLKERAEAARTNGMAGIADAVSHGSVSEASRKANPVVPAFVRESLMRQDPRGYADHCIALSEAKPARHDAIKAPTLLIAGEKDPVAPVPMGKALAQAITGARLEVIPDVAHWMMMEAPGRTASLLKEHLH
ncbi:alpha/beta fold hydrolase [Hwanghaeella grinnelliae]|uniref:Alpha/beta fold hydrolase n=1 Tax=Hwanghaeella grinnelliae TaxID=2500179 RepID=A0A437QUD7_9PROT|nr:alpha/beta hydrolase [Hwanghaeella grinnelliae]RVU38108.1 alpha/beta fold hydrolase [Hwanghaeella grinnelliae]